jgi:hypothetical protein
LIRAAALAVSLAIAPAVPAGASRVPEGLAAHDTPDDGGRSITVRWDVPESAPEDLRVRLERVGEDGVARDVGVVALSEGVFIDARNGNEEGPPDGVSLVYRLTTLFPDGSESLPAETAPAVSKPQFFNSQRINVLLLLSTFFAFVLVNIARASRGARFHVRKLPAVAAIDEAIGRATEMGRSVLYVPGIEDVEDIQTIASMMILSRVARETARHDVPVRVPTRTPFVMAVADEVVKQSCMEAGRPDAYQTDSVRFISTEQFAYCAGVNGIILREKPAANLYLGRFFAESLIFAETGFAAGSIQIAGTAEVTQLPFFIAACDYTLIGEEFFAASAYMSEDPMLLSNLKAADWAKVLFVSLLLVGTLMESLGVSGFRDWFLVR